MPMEGAMDVVLLELLTLLRELLASEKFAAAMGPMAAAQRARCGSRPCRPRALVAGGGGEDKHRYGWRSSRRPPSAAAFPPKL